MIKYIILLTSVVAVAQCFVCPENFCDNVECENLSNCRAENGFKVRERGDWCKCCDLCVLVLGENERCTPQIELGVIYRSECAEGLHCPPDVERCVKV